MVRLDHYLDQPPGEGVNFDPRTHYARLLSLTNRVANQF